MVRDTVAVETLALAATLRMSMSQHIIFPLGAGKIGSALLLVVARAAEKCTHEPDQLAHLPLFAPSRFWLNAYQSIRGGGGGRKHYQAEFQGLGRIAGKR